MVRSTSSLRPISGSMRPSWARALRLTANFSSALPDSLSRSLSIQQIFEPLVTVAVPVG